MEKSTRILTILFSLVIVGFAILIPLVPAPETEEQPYSLFLQDITNDQVKSATIAGKTLAATYADGGVKYVRLPPQTRQVEVTLLQHSVPVEYQEGVESPGIANLMVILLPFLLIGGVLWFMGGGGEAGQEFSFGESRAEQYVATEKRVTMQDVAGMPEVKEELAEIIDFLKEPERYQELGARIPKGVLLFGPPGTGKTLLARAVAGEAGVAFLATSGSDFVELFAGVGAARTRDLFRRARQSAPCIIFIDEIDAVGRRRGVAASSGGDEREQTINQLLVEMDGFQVGEGLIVMAATNRPDILDPALLRPGRFDRQIAVDLPDRQGRLEILNVHACTKPLAADVDLERVAGMTPGFAGADLANLLNEAALLAARSRREAISMSELGLAYERISAGGPALHRVMTPAERWRMALHEAGHGVVTARLPYGDTVTKVTIIPRGQAMGYTLSQPREEKALQSRTDMMNHLTALLGGRAAEEVLLGETGTGAADDLKQATRLARRMAIDLGMSRELGPVVLDPGNCDQTAQAVDEAVRSLVLEAHCRAVELVRTHREALEHAARLLMDRESLEGQELEQILAFYGDGGAGIDRDPGTAV